MREASGFARPDSQGELILQDETSQTGRWPVTSWRQAAMALGRALARREQGGARVPRLMTLAERNRRFPGAVYDARYLA